MACASAFVFVLVACNALVGLDRDYQLARDGADADADRSGDGSPADAPIALDDGGLDGAIDANDGGCVSKAGPPMVRVDGYCIDSTEVTEAQYQQFLAADAGFGGDAHPECAWKDGGAAFAPGKAGLAKCRWDPSQYPNLPVVCVDWCDAFAYCRWAGKRLCGAIDGGPDGAPIAWDAGDDTNAEKDEWYRACSFAGTRKFPYDGPFKPNTCNGIDNFDGGKDAGMVVDAGSMTGCMSGYDGLYDMVGNAFEFENSCNATTGPNDLCKLRGGSWAHSEKDFNSCTGLGVGDRRNARFDDIGFRCCSVP